MLIRTIAPIGILVMKTKPLKKIPRFKSEDAERAFWAKADTSRYFDMTKPRTVLLPDFNIQSADKFDRGEREIRAGKGVSDAEARSRLKKWQR